MPNQISEQEASQNATMDMIQRHAMKIVALPDSDREEHFEIVRKALKETVVVLKLSERQADDWVRVLMSTLRALVLEIDAVGG